MKKLYIIRHAKSSWQDFSLEDWERPLNKRGKKNIPEMGEYLNSKNISIELLISSHAERAFKTAIGIGKSLGYPKNQIQENSDLYHAGFKQIFEIVRSIPKDINTAAIFGHNPGFTTFANSLTNSHIENIPTCGVCAVDLPVDDWSEVTEGTGKIDFFMFPKGL